jgi:hypothetical protein
MTSVRRNLKWDIVSPPVAFPKASSPDSDQTARRLFSSEVLIPSSSSSRPNHNTSLESSSANHQNSGSSGSDDSLIAPSFQPLVLRRLEGGGRGENSRSRGVHDGTTDVFDSSTSSYQNFAKENINSSQTMTSAVPLVFSSTSSLKKRKEEEIDVTDDQEVTLLATSAVARALLLPNSPNAPISSYQRHQQLPSSSSSSSLSVIDFHQQPQVGIQPSSTSPTPEAIAAAADWRKVNTVDGKVYFYNKTNRVSVWSLPTGIDATLVKATTAPITTTTTTTTLSKATAPAPVPAPAPVIPSTTTTTTTTTSVTLTTNTTNILNPLQSSSMQSSKQKFQSPNVKKNPTHPQYHHPMGTATNDHQNFDRSLIDQQPLSPSRRCHVCGERGVAIRE